MPIGTAISSRKASTILLCVCSVGCSVGQGPRSHAARNAALASSRLSASPCRYFVLPPRDHFVALRNFGAERARSSMVMRESASENAFSAFAEAGPTTPYNGNGEDAFARQE